MSLESDIEAVLAIDPNAPALEFEARWRSWGELAGQAGSIRAALAAAGVPDGASYEKGRAPGAPPRLRSGVQIVTAPLAHIAGITGLMNNLLAGRKVCLIERFTVEGFRDAVVRHRPKVAGAPPSALRMLLDA